jgi:hypothetical protein
MAYACQMVNGYLRLVADSNQKPCKSIDDVMALLDEGRIPIVADDDMPELRRRLEVRAMLSDPEYAVPGEIQRRVEAWPEKTDRRIDSLEKRLAFLEATVHRMLNAGSVQDGE